MSEIDFFERTSIKLIDNEVYANREQLKELYEAPKKTISDNINRLKDDGLIVGAKIRPKSGKPFEVYNLDEIIALGLRLRSDRAIAFQRWAINQLRNTIVDMQKKVRHAELMESIAWNHLDAVDNHR